MQLQEWTDLTPYTTLAVPARARALIEVASESALREALAWVHGHRLPYVVLGSGSNVLFVDDYPGAVIHMGLRGVDAVPDSGAADDVFLDVAAGENWHALVTDSVRQGWFGLENLALIPGTVGAAPVQNIGAYGVEIGDCLESVETLDIASATRRHWSRQDCQLEYRDSIFKQPAGSGQIILKVRLRLSTRPRVRVTHEALADLLRRRHGHLDVSPMEVFDAVCEVRRARLPDPLTLPNAGSVFKNPVVSRQQAEALHEAYPGLPMYPVAEDDRVKLPAAWLLDQCGWRGYRDGGIGVHENHALVVVNPGRESGQRVAALIESLQTSVRQRFDIALEPEVRLIFPG